MTIIHTPTGSVCEPVETKGFHPQPESTRIRCGSWGSVNSSTIHRAYYYYKSFKLNNKR